MAEGDEDSEDDSEEEIASQDATNDESENIYSEEGTQDSMGSSEREEGNISSHWEEDDMPIVHVLECTRCLWVDHNNRSIV